MLNGTPEKEPYEKDDTIDTNDGSNTGSAQVPLEHFAEAKATASCYEGQKREQYVYSGKRNGRDLHQDDENGDGILSRARAEDGEDELERAGVAVDIGVFGGIDVDATMVLDGLCHVVRLG